MATTSLPVPTRLGSGSSPQTNRRLGRVPAFDGLRAVLVAAVVAFHLADGAMHSAIGEVAVIVFFVLSGFLITRLLVEEHEGTGRIAIGAFYARRLRRLVPALAAMLAVWLAVALLLGHEPWLTSVPGGGPGAPISPYTALEGVGVALGYLTNWLDALKHIHWWIGYVPLGHLWSLAVEEQFYLIWAPAMLLIVRVRRFFGALGLLTLVALAEPLLLWPQGTVRIYFGTDTRAGALLLGALVAVAWGRGHLDWLGGRAASSVVLASSAIGLYVSGLGFNGAIREWSFLGGMTLAALCGAAVTATLAARRDDTASRWLSTPMATWLGRRSYAVYLWSYVLNTWFRHLGLATIPVVLGATLLAAELSYRLVEAPFFRRRPRSWRSPGTACRPRTEASV